MCVYTHIYIHIYVCVRARVCARMCVCVCMHASVFAHIACVCVCLPAWVRACLCVRVDAYVRCASCVGEEIGLTLITLTYWLTSILPVSLSGCLPRAASPRAAAFLIQHSFSIYIHILSPSIDIRMFIVIQIRAYCCCSFFLFMFTRLSVLLQYIHAYTVTSLLWIHVCVLLSN